MLRVHLYKPILLLFTCKNQQKDFRKSIELDDTLKILFLFYAFYDSSVLILLLLHSDKQTFHEVNVDEIDIDLHVLGSYDHRPTGRAGRYDVEVDWFHTKV